MTDTMSNDTDFIKTRLEIKAKKQQIIEGIEKSVREINANSLLDPFMVAQQIGILNKSKTSEVKAIDKLQKEIDKQQLKNENKKTKEKKLKQTKAETGTKLKAILDSKSSKDGLNGIVEDENEGAMIIYEYMKDKLKYCNRLFYLNEDGTKYWTSDTDAVDSKVLNIILNSNIRIARGESVVSFAQNLTIAKHMREILYSILKENPDNSLYEKFHTTTKKKICFMDGVLDFKDKQFYKWDEITFELYSPIRINREFNHHFLNPNPEIIALVKEKIFDNLFNKDTDKGIHFLSRAIAGECGDKNWGVYEGDRDCGKGVIFDALINAFEGYVAPFNLSYMLIQRQSKVEEASRMNYWLLDYEFVRLPISQETPKPDSGLKLSGREIKQKASGNDTHIARRNYDRQDTYFKIDCTFLIMGNNELLVDEADAFQHCVKFSSVNQFQSQQYIDDMINNNESPLLINKYKVRDENIKTSCTSEEWKNAVVHILLNGYRDYPVHIEMVVDEDTDNCLRRKILTHYNITKDKTHIILAQDVETFLDSPKSKIKNEFESMGVPRLKVKKGDLRDKQCYIGLVLIPKEEFIDQLTS